MIDVLSGNFQAVKRPVKQDKDNSSLATDDSIMDNKYRGQ